MPDMVTIANRSTGKVVGTVPVDFWNNIQRDRQWKGVFIVVATINEPPEVVALRERLSREKLAKQ